MAIPVSGICLSPLSFPWMVFKVSRTLFRVVLSLILLAELPSFVIKSLASHKLDPFFRIKEIKVVDEA